MNASMSDDHEHERRDNNECNVKAIGANCLGSENCHGF